MTNPPVATPLRMPRHYAEATAGEQLPWEHPERHLHEAKNYWIATTNANGTPHVTPVWGVWHANALYVDGIPTATWARNLARDARASFHLESGDDVLIVEGVVEDIERIDDPALAEASTTHWREKYEMLVPNVAQDGIFCFRPLVARGWSRFPHDATKWRFDGLAEG